MGKGKLLDREQLRNVAALTYKHGPDKERGSVQLWLSQQQALVGFPALLIAFVLRIRVPEQRRG